MFVCVCVCAGLRAWVSSRRRHIVLGGWSALWGHCTNFASASPGVIEPSRHSTVRHFMRLSLYLCLSLFILLNFAPCCCKYEYWFFLPRPARTPFLILSLSVYFSLCCVLSAISLLVIEYNFALYRILLLLIAMRSVAFLLFCLVSYRRRSVGERQDNTLLLLLLLCSARSTPFYAVPSLLFSVSAPVCAKRSNSTRNSICSVDVGAVALLLLRLCSFTRAVE